MEIAFGLPQAVNMVSDPFGTMTVEHTQTIKELRNEGEDLVILCCCHDNGFTMDRLLFALASASIGHCRGAR